MWILYVAKQKYFSKIFKLKYLKIPIMRQGVNIKIFKMKIFRIFYEHQKKSFRKYTYIYSLQKYYYF